MSITIKESTNENTMTTSSSFFRLLSRKFIEFSGKRTALPVWLECAFGISSMILFPLFIYLAFPFLKAQFASDVVVGAIIICAIAFLGTIFFYKQVIGPRNNYRIIEHMFLSFFLVILGSIIYMMLHSNIEILKIGLLLYGITFIPNLFKSLAV